MENLSRLIESSGKSQKQIAADLQITQQRFNSYALGKRQPDIDLMIKIADYFNVTLDYLMGRTNNPFYVHTYKEDGKDVAVYSTKKDPPAQDVREEIRMGIAEADSRGTMVIDLPAGTREYIESLVRIAVAQELHKLGKD